MSQLSDSDRRWILRNNANVLWRVFRPAYVVGGQLALLGISIFAFYLVKASGQLISDPELHPDPRFDTYFSTLFGSVLSLASSFLFAEGVRHAIILSLTRSVPVSLFGFGIRLSRRSLILKKQYVKWTFISIVLALVPLAQTPGWVYLTIPTIHAFTLSVNGTELDTTSQAFVEQFPQIWQSDLQNSVITTKLAPVFENAGAASASAQAGYRSILDFGGWGFNSSTRGVYPLSFEPFYFNFNTTPVTSNKSLIAANTAGFPLAQAPLLSQSNPRFSYSINQEGHTANVSCTSATLNESSDPPLFRVADVVQIPTNDGSLQLTRWTVTTKCADGGNGTNGGPVLSTTNNTLTMTTCSNAQDLNSMTSTIIIDGQGLYSFAGSMICTITPRVYDTLSTYSTSLIGGRIVDNSTEGKDAGPVGGAAVSALFSMFAGAQNDARNSVGDALLTLSANVGNGKGPNVTVPELMEAYITGAIEFAVTAIKTELASPDGVFKGNPPRELLKYFSGTVTLTTMGLQYSVTTILAMLPVIFMSLLTISIVVVAEFRARCSFLGGGRYVNFDPADPWALMAAASAGGMTEVFESVDGDLGRGQRVMLGYVEGKECLVHV
ncbi:hypothetical protein R3P38DRAFT_2866246 [Favolaschia claudopus]|uniref:Uncharacterized protein n=1 Tax=Favolaschia claudopus TaxID=2862362 RepID=A0AAW0DHH7_9AGAR